MPTQTSASPATKPPTAGALADQRHQLFEPPVPPLACAAPGTTPQTSRQQAAA